MSTSCQISRSTGGVVSAGMEAVRGSTGNSSGLEEC